MGEVEGQNNAIVDQTKTWSDEEEWGPIACVCGPQQGPQTLAGKYSAGRYSPTPTHTHPAHE